MELHPGLGLGHNWLRSGRDSLDFQAWILAGFAFLRVSDLSLHSRIEVGGDRSRLRWKVGDNTWHVRGMRQWLGRVEGMTRL